MRERFGKLRKFSEPEQGRVVMEAGTEYAFKRPLSSPARMPGIFDSKIAAVIYVHEQP